MEGGRRGAGRAGQGGLGSSLFGAGGDPRQCPATQGYRYTDSWDAAEREVRRLQEELVASQAREAAAKAREAASLRRAEELEAEVVALRASGQYIVNYLHAGAPGSSVESRMLRVPAAVRRIARRGIRQATVVTMAMAEAHTEADCSGVDGFPESTPLNKFNLRAYEASADAVEWMVPVDGLLNDVA